MKTETETEIELRPPRLAPLTAAQEGEAARLLAECLLEAARRRSCASGRVTARALGRASGVATPSAEEGGKARRAA